MSLALISPRARFGFQFVVLARRWRHELDSRLAAVGLTDATWSPLIHLEESGDGLHQKDLAALAGIDASSLVRLIDRLESRGLVQRRPHPTDRRARLVFLTQAGRGAVTDIRALLVQAEADMLGGLADADLESMLDGFERIGSRLRHMRDERERKP